MESAESTLLELVERVRAWIHRSRTDHQPGAVPRGFWMPDDSCRVCYECDAQFTIFNRRHHCRICGRVFCRKCTHNTIPIPMCIDDSRNGDDRERIKVCNYCYKICKQEIAAAQAISNAMQVMETPNISPTASEASIDSGKLSWQSSASGAMHTAGSNQNNASSSNQNNVPSSSTQTHNPQQTDDAKLSLSKMQDTPHSERSSSCDEAFSPGVLGYYNTRSDDEGDDYCKNLEDTDARVHLRAHSGSEYYSGYSSPTYCDDTSRYGASVDQSVYQNSLIDYGTSTGDMICKELGSQNHNHVTKQSSPQSGKLKEENQHADNMAICSEGTTVYHTEEIEIEQPFDIENNMSIWTPPPPEDEEDDMEMGMVDDEDDEDGNWGLPRSSGSFGSSEHKNKEKSCEEHKDAMRSVLDVHFRALVGQLLKGAGISIEEENLNENWLEIVTSLSWQAATFVKPDTSKGGGMDPAGYVKVKCLACGHLSDSKVIKGIVCSKNVKHKRMASRYKNAKLLILAGALEYQRVSNQLSSLDTLLQQEMDHLKITVKRIEAHHPNVLIVEKSVSHHAQEYLLAKDISLVLNVKKKLLERIARCTGAQVIPSVDNLSSPKVGSCESFHVERFVEIHGNGTQSARKQAKTLMFFEGCPKRLGCTILLMGACRDELKKVKSVIQYSVFAAYHLALETSFLADEGATLPELPLKSPLTVALPDNTSNLDNSISTISSLPVSQYEKMGTGETRDIKNSDEISSITKETSSIPTIGTLNETEDATVVHEWSIIEEGKIRNSGLGNGDLSLSSTSINHVGVSCNELSANVTSEKEDISQMEGDSNILPEDYAPGLRNDENTSFNEEFPPSPSDHQSILVLQSSRCALKGTICGGSQLFRIKYYGTFDKPLGRYLRDDLFDENSRCGVCKEPSEAHVLCFTHRHGSLTISVRRMPLLMTLAGEREGKIWMWHRCLKCVPKGGVPQATQRVVMSDAAWGLSFGKFLELSFSNHAAASRVASCGHSLHRDCLRFYGFGSMVACFRYSTVKILSVHLPPSKLIFSDPFQQEWLQKEVTEVTNKVDGFFTELYDCLCQIELDVGFYGTMNNEIKEYEGVLIKERSEFEVLLKEVISYDRETGKPFCDILELNRLKHQLLETACAWKQRFRELDSFIKMKSSFSKLESHSSFASQSMLLKGFDSIQNGNIGENQAKFYDIISSSSFSMAKRSVSEHTEIKCVQLDNDQGSEDGSVKNRARCNMETSPHGDLDGLNIVKEPSKNGFNTDQSNGDESKGVVTSVNTSFTDKGVSLSHIGLEYVEHNSVKCTGGVLIGAVINRGNSDHYLSGDGQHSKIPEQNIQILSDLSDTLDAAWTGEGQVVKSHTQLAVSHKQETVIGRLAFDVNENENDCRKSSHSFNCRTNASLIKLQDIARSDISERSIPNSPLKSVHLSEDSTSWFGTSPTNLSRSSSRRYQRFPSGSFCLDHARGSNVSVATSGNNLGSNGERLLLPNGTNDVVVAVYDDEPTSIIAYALSSPDYLFHINDRLLDGEIQREKPGDLDREIEHSATPIAVSHGRWSSDISLDLSELLMKERSSGSEDLAIYGSKGSVVSDSILYSKDTHAKISFSDDGPPGKVKYTVTCYHARQFDALRKKCCPTEMDFRRSLSRCKKWGAQGGKSNVFFAKSLDDRLIIKQVTRTEMDSFMRFASAYFKYLSESLSSGSPTCLAKILGIYQVVVKHAKGGREVRMDLMVMENLLFRRNVTRVYDLKGSHRSRYNSDSTGNNTVLLDQNLLETMPTAPIFVGNKAKRLLERAVWNDTAFLASVDVMDYSLLVGVDEEHGELVLGIIDFMRQYTWDKHLETWVKASGILGGPKNVSPTVISPKQYKVRFRKAMSTYFLMIPDQWSPPSIISCPIKLDAKDAQR